MKSGISSALGSLKLAKRQRMEGSQEPKHLSAVAPLPVAGRAKSKDPAFIPKKFFLRETTCNEAFHKWKCAKGGDESDLVQKLLSEYLEGGR